MKPRSIPAGEFKAKCLALMDEVQAKRTPITITKNGKPVARLVPEPFEGKDPIFGFFRDRGRVIGDITEPLYTEQEYEEFYERKTAMYEPVRKPVAK